jgi:SAM-dependent methyltransferase
MPERYVAPSERLWRHLFEQRVAALLEPELSILDVGCGRRPAVPADRRPPGVRYVAIDIDPCELALAPAGAYDETHLADIAEFQPTLENRFDLALSLFVFEHVRALGVALENVRRYLRPGGTLVAQLAGGRSVHAIVNRLVPQRAAAGLAYWSMGTNRARRGRVFPAHYDLCHDSALRRALSGWSEVEIVPQFTGAQYFRWSRLAAAVYLGYEEWTYRRGLGNLATWYLVTAKR